MAETDQSQLVIVAGFGPVGRAVTDALEQADITVTIVELNQATVQTQTHLGRSILQGDIGDPKVLGRAGIAKAHAMIITVPDRDASLKAVVEARRLSPALFIAARMHHMSGALAATQAGADHVTIEEVITARSMQQAVMRRLLSDNPA